MVSRIGTSPLPETAEEIRLCLLTLLHTLLQSKCNSIIVAENIDDLTKILCASISDNYPDAKKMATICLVDICNIAPTHLHSKVESLSSALMNSMRHQHSKVRNDCLIALGKLIPCGAEGIYIYIYNMTNY